MITPEQWTQLDEFRKGIEAEYVRSVNGKPERLPAYDETLGVLKEALDRYGVDQENMEQVYFLCAGIVSSLAFVNQYFQVVCSDPHMMAHLSEAAIFMGYLVRELCFGVEAPVVTA